MKLTGALCQFVAMASVDFTQPLAAAAHQPVITIDGTFASGRHTLAHSLARSLGYKVGSFDQALTLIANKMMKADGHLEDISAAAGLAEKLSPETLFTTPQEKSDYNPAQMALAFKLGRNRDLTPMLQARFAELAEATPQGLVLVGTAMGRQVFPQAPVRVFLHATPHIRQHREAARLHLASGHHQAVEQIEMADMAMIHGMGGENGLRPMPGYQDNQIREPKELPADAPQPELYIITDSISKHNLHKLVLAVAQHRLGL